MFRWAVVLGIVMLSAALLVKQSRPVGAAPSRPVDPSKMETSTLAALRATPKEWAEIPADPATKIMEVFRLIRLQLYEQCRTDIEFTINFDAFEEAGEPGEALLDTSPVASVRLPKVVNEPLARYLSRLAKRMTAHVPAVPGGVLFLVRTDSIELTTFRNARKQIWGIHEGIFFPLVHADYKHTPLAEALRDLAEQSEQNVVVDARVTEMARTPITARFMNTPLDTAVFLLTDMADLQYIMRDNVMYVTTRDNALRIETRQKRELHREDEPGAPVGIPPRVGTGVRGFIPKQEAQGGGGAN